MKQLYRQFDKLQLKYGAKELNSIYGGGCENIPDFCFVFMNPTGRNIASVKAWQGIRYPWLGTKNIWKLFAETGIIPKTLNEQIQMKKSDEWSKEFCDAVYNEISKSSVYITNLAKCTQVDARHLDDSIYKEYLELFKYELEIVKPKTIILFGNQVSSIVLNKNIKVSEQRKVENIYNGKTFTAKIFTVFYPIGNGRFNLPKAIEDLHYILANNK